MTHQKGGTSPRDSPIGFGSRRLLLGPRREKARGRLRPPAPLLRGKATPQLCARAAGGPGPSSSSSPPPAGPFVGEERRGRRTEGGAPDLPGALCCPPGTRPRRHPRFACPRGRRPSRSRPPAGAAPAPAPLGSPAPQLCSRKAALLGSGSGPGPAQAATAGWTPGTWRPGSPDRAPRQSAPALRVLPARSSGPGARLAWGCAPGAVPGADRACRESGAGMGTSRKHSPLYSHYPKMLVTPPPWATRAVQVIFPP